LALRCRIVLACAEGASNQAVAERLGISRPTVTKWRSRFVARRLEGLADEPRPGAARTITDEQVEQVLVTTLETTPKDATHWSTRSLARQLGMSQSAISRIWRAFGLKPHLVDTFKLSTDPQFIDKVRDVVGLYMNPPPGGDRAVRGREDPGASAGPYRPDPAPAARGCPSGPPTTTPAMGSLTCMPRWMWQAARSSPR
jgi:transposase